ncbi:MAG: hypothetical protein AAGC65_07875 [Mucilaginibacter sp.]|uniref:hypothetical protein n=1 Tax=Mucilaginibacter sp. TaxID=1882438 RepID=UPI0031A8DD01
MKNLLSLCLAALLFTACSKDKQNDVKTPSEKKVRVEVAFSGNYQNYQLLFSVNSLTKGSGTFVEPVITAPANTAWTQVVSQGNAYNYIGDITSASFVVEGKEAVNRLGFTLSTTQTHNTDDTSQAPISATIKVYADNKQIETYTYKALPAGQVTTPISENLDISTY